MWYGTTKLIFNIGIPKLDHTSQAIFLNAWGHKNPEGIHAVIASQAKDLDVCCLTEVTSMGKIYKRPAKIHTSLNPEEPPSSIDGLQQLERQFSGEFHIKYISPDYRTWKCELTGKTVKQVGYGSVMLIKKDVLIRQTGFYAIVKNIPNVNERVLQYVVYEKNDVRYLVAHLHGVWFRHNTKGDELIRFQQSKEVRSALFQVAERSKVDRIIFGGDFNLGLHTRSLLLLEGINEPNFRNLIREFKIKSTRTRSYRKYDIPGETMHADYVLVSKSVNVHAFTVDTNVTASDHAPLLVTFS